MNIKEVTENTGLILAEAIGARFTGDITIKVSLRDGGIAAATASRSGEMIAGERFQFGAPPQAKRATPQAPLL